ncbi:MAG: tRNA 2-thiouridine(34) synthase MnmA [Simkaniaceae bacterium]|nr:tRNA 2-thiouridine(34) synthase MnmA [Simkaniaceae bacterium]
MKVAVALSGGVDSALSARLLKEAGHDVFALFMHNWDERDPDRGCVAAYDFEDVVAVCDILRIPYYSLNFTKEYRERVFSRFLDVLKGGQTPNPDVLCNKEIKFRLLYEKALSMGADALATGHYCRTVDGRLFKGKDPGKDQSYFLYALRSSVLRRVLFPVGHLHKKEVRRMAKEAGLPVCDKKDSTGICFIGERNFATFLQDHIPPKQGRFETEEGQVVGEHKGVAYYTIGQRRGLGIGGLRGYSGEAWYVTGKDPERNVVIVAQGENHPSLFSEGLVATDLSLINRGSPSLPERGRPLRAKIRYRQRELPCTVRTERGGSITVLFKDPVRAATPGQSIVFFDGEECLGGAIISAITSSSGQILQKPRPDIVYPSVKDHVTSGSMCIADDGRTR